MADTPWYSLAPSASPALMYPDAAGAAIQAGQQRVAAENTIANTLSTEQQTAARQYAQNVTQTLNQLMSQSIGPNGFDQDKFVDLASKTPYGSDAVNMAIAKINSLHESERQGVGTNFALGLLGAKDQFNKSHSVDVTQTMQTSDPSNPSSVLAGVDSSLPSRQQVAHAPQAASAGLASLPPSAPVDNTPIQAGGPARDLGTGVISAAPNQQAQQQQGAPPQVPAQPSYWASLANPEVASPQALLSGSVTGKTADDIAKMGPKDRASLVQGLQSKELVGKDPTNEEVAVAINTVSKNAQLEKLSGLNPFDLESVGKAISSLAFGGPQASQEAIGGVQDLGRQATSAYLGQAGQRTSNERNLIGLSQDQLTKQAVDSVEAQGFNADQSNVGTIQTLLGKQASLKGSMNGVLNWLSRPKDIQAMDSRTFASNVLTPALLAPMSSENIGTEAGRSAFDANFLAQPDVKVFLQRHSLSPELVTQAISGTLAADQRIPILRRIYGMENELLKNGINTSSLNVYRKKGWANQSPSSPVGPKPLSGMSF